jgi:hypothetical protein
MMNPQTARDAHAISLALPQKEAARLSKPRVHGNGRGLRAATS